MAKFGGAALKFIQTLLYAIEFCCAAIVLGIYSYFLSVLADRNAPIFTWAKAVEGISGAAVLYTILAVLLTCFLGGKAFFAFLAIALDILFCAAFVALAVLTRDGKSCGSQVNTPLGSGPRTSKQGFGSAGQGNQVTYAASLGTICRLNTACFAVSIIGAILFLISALVQILLHRHHKKEKRFGPGPSNNYGNKRKFWQRKKAHRTGLRDPETGAVPMNNTTGTHGTHAAGTHDYRHSQDTAYTGTTAQSNAYDTHKPVAGGYHTAPTGTYNNNHAAPTHSTPATNW